MINSLRNRGIALFISIALLFLLSVGTIVVLLIAYNYTLITERQIKRLRALTLAEAGINHAYWQLRTDPSYTGSTITPDESGYDVVIVVTSDAGRKRIKSTAQIDLVF